MASGNLLAVIRYHGPVVPQWPLIDPGQHSLYKTVFLADSHDQGKTWKNLRPLTNVHGQCHGFAAGLSDGSVVVTHDHRYPPGTPGGKAMISRDEGRTWEDEVYHLYFATKPGGLAGFSESVVLEDDTILTLAGATDVGRAKRLSASNTGGVFKRQDRQRGCLGDPVEASVEVGRPWPAPALATPHSPRPPTQGIAGCG